MDSGRQRIAFRLMLEKIEARELGRANNDRLPRGSRTKGDNRDAFFVGLEFLAAKPDGNAGGALAGVVDDRQLLSDRAHARQ